MVGVDRPRPVGLGQHVPAQPGDVPLRVERPGLGHAAGYQQHSFSVIQFKGQTIKIRFLGTEDSRLQTSFVIDDTALNVQ